LHDSQQNQKNRVSQPKIKGLPISYSQEARFFTQVQDVSNVTASSKWVDGDLKDHQNIENKQLYRKIACVGSEETEIVTNNARICP